jgi:glycine/D-amino acid oxidase-like deaminating enzyme
LVERAELAAGASGRNHGLLLSPLDPALAPMARASAEAYDELSRSSPLPFHLDQEPLGFLLVAGADEAERASGREEADAASASGVPVEHLDGSGIHRLEPALATDLVEGWLLRDARRLDPAALTAALALSARAHGADVRTRTMARSVVGDGDAVRGVATDDGVLEGDVVVVAAGPWTPTILRTANVRLPITGGRGWLVHLSPPRPVVTRLVGRAGWHVVAPGDERVAPTVAADVVDGLPAADTGTLLQPNPDGTILVGGSRQVVMTNEPEDPALPRHLIREAIRLAPALADAQLLGAWWGIRPITPDGRPMVGPIRDGLVVAAGHGPVGVILGAGTGRLVTSLVLNEPPPFDPKPFTPSRFE